MDDLKDTVCCIFPLFEALSLSSLTLEDVIIMLVPFPPFLILLFFNDDVYVEVLYVIYFQRI